MSQLSVKRSYTAFQSEAPGFEPQCSPHRISFLTLPTGENGSKKQVLATSANMLGVKRRLEDMRVSSPTGGATDDSKAPATSSVFDSSTPFSLPASFGVPSFSAASSVSFSPFPTPSPFSATFPSATPAPALPVSQLTSPGKPGRTLVGPSNLDALETYKRQKRLQAQPTTPTRNHDEIKKPFAEVQQVGLEDLSAPGRKKKFTREEVEELLKEQRAALEEEFTRIINQRLSEQFEHFSRFSQDCVSRQMTKEISYLS